MQADDKEHKIAKVEVSVFRVPISRPVITSFGAMTSRPAVFVRIEDSEGAFGWGEIFANWPAAGAEHRARLLMEDISDLVLQQSFARAPDMIETLFRKTHIRALQCGEWGPFAHVIAGLDIAYQDLLARRADLPMARFLNADARSSVPTYASGIHIRDADRAIDEGRAAGFNAFKVKVGFSLADDLQRVSHLAGSLHAGERLFTDANQGWQADDAIAFVKGVQGLAVGWLEEPLAADAPAEDWRRVAEASSIPLAGGENMAGAAQFDAAIASGIFDVIQPDVAKWGGVSKCREIAIRTTENGRLYCPHFLGGGIGLAASAAVLASIRGDGLLEVDHNANPLREAFALWTPGEGRNRFRISDLPGLGIVELPEEIAQYRTLALRATKPGQFSIVAARDAQGRG